MPLDAARRALDLASGETLVTARAERALRVAADGPARERTGEALEVTAVRGGSVGVATADSFEDEAIAAAVARAEADAETGAGPGDYPGLPVPGAMRAH